MRSCSSGLSSDVVRSIRATLPVLVIVAALASPTFADAPDPRQGIRIVDGDSGEWMLANDFFAYMYRAGKINKPIESTAYLRYDCNTFTLYVAVLGEPGVPIVTIPAATAWVAINGQDNKVVDGDSGSDGSPPDFAWIGQPPAPGDSVAVGYEASFVLGPGSYSLIVHADVFDADKTQTSATTGFPRSGVDLVLDCMVPTESLTWGRIKSLYR
jgi:hypothetical protein